MKPHPFIASRPAVCSFARRIAVSAQEVVVPDGKAYTGKKLTAQTYNSGFPEATTPTTAWAPAATGRSITCSAPSRTTSAPRCSASTPRRRQIR